MGARVQRTSGSEAFSASGLRLAKAGIRLEGLRVEREGREGLGEAWRRDGGNSESVG
jgi:hypothetical protein